MHQRRKLPCCLPTVSELRDVKSFDNDVSLSEGVRGVGKERAIQLTASQVLAVQDLIGIEVKTRCGLMYSRFVAHKKMYSSIEYVRAKRHINRSVTFEHCLYKYGIILGSTNN